MHQIRRHFAQLRHYLIGDKRYGECKHNKMFEEHFGLDTMLLHARTLSFQHPFTQQNITIEAPLSQTFERVLTELGFDLGEI
jgi:tRNA pseudouridine65 synthase